MTYDTMTEQDLRRRAVRRINAKLGFRSHATVFVLVNLSLAALNLTTSPGYLWFVWPLFGWGIGLAAHGLAVYGAGAGESQREAMIAREMDRLRAGQGGGR